MQSVGVVIRGADRENFLDKPEQLYKDKEVCISGTVQLYNNIPQIVIYRKEQIKVKSPIDIADVSFFAGDTVTVSGRVFSAKHLQGSATSPTLLNLGAAYPDQLLTVVIESKDRPNFMQQPENFYAGKEISVTGKVMLYKDKPQIVIQRKEQIRVTNDNAIQFVTMQENAAKAGDSKVEESKGSSISRPAIFPGGDDAWMKLMKKNLKCPDELPVGEEKVVVARFHVSAMGYITNTSIVSSGGKVFDNEVLRVLKLMPQWLPQLVNGKPVSSVITRTVTFIQIGEKDLKPF
jgi:micrococcal nuclease